MPGPIVVSAVVVRDRDGRVLTVRKTGTSMFMLPGGKHEPGESARDAAARELAEETGLHADRLDLLGEYVTDTANEPGLVLESTVYVLPGAVTGPVEPAGEIAQLRWIETTERGDDIAPLLRDGVLPDLLGTPREP